MVPRLSAPIMTYALSTPGRGLATVVAINASHFPSIEETSSCVVFTIWSIKDDFPRVPTRMAIEFLTEADETFEIAGFTFVTWWMSDAKSKAARCTPGQSSEERKIGVAFPSATIGNAKDDFWKVTQLGWPMARHQPTKAQRKAIAPTNII